MKFRNRSMVPLSGIAVAFACLLGCAHSPAGSPKPQESGAPAAGEAPIRALLGELESAVNARDLGAILRLYNFPDSSAADSARRRIEAEIAPDTLRCALHPGPIEIRGDSAAAPVLREVSYREHGRVQGASQWWSYAFRRTSGAWRIVSEDERDYARTRTIDLHVKLEPETGAISETAVLTLEFLLPGETSVVLELDRGLELTRLRDGNGREPKIERTGTEILVPLPSPAAAGDSLRLEITCAGTLFNESREQGYSQVSVAPEGCFASWVTAWYPRLEGAGSKARGRIVFDVPQGHTVASSGRPAERTLAGGRERQAFTVSAPLDYSFAAARYFHREVVIDGATLGVYFLGGGDRKADLYLTECGRILGVLRDLYGAYPFDGYAVVEIPSAAAGTLGGSSEQGMNLFPVGMLPDDRVPLPLLAHEMGHSWWGNLIQGEDGPVLDEGLAQVSAVLCIRRLEGEPAMRRFLKYGWTDYGQSARMYFSRFAPAPATDLPIASRAQGAQDRSALHDLADVKGHFVYNMLRESIGDEAFLGGLRAIIRDRAGKTFTLRDLQAAWERASGRGLQPFFDQWFYRAGAPELALRDLEVTRGDTVAAPGDGYAVRGSIAQIREPFEAEVEVVTILPESTEVRRIPISGPSTDFSFRVPVRPKAVLLDPDYKLLRWAEEFENDSLMATVASLRSLGRYAEARTSLEAFLERHPDAADAAYQLGLCEQEAGRPGPAERRYRAVLDQYASYPAYNPNVPLAALGLGELCDLSGRREEAMLLYNRVVSLPDVSGSHDEAAALLKAPYRAQPAPSFPAPDELKGYAADYASDLVGQVEVMLEPSGILTLQGPDGRRSALIWIGGSQFRLASQEKATVEFPRNREQEMVVRLGEREFRFRRASESTAR